MPMPEEELDVFDRALLQHNVHGLLGRSQHRGEKECTCDCDGDDEMMLALDSATAALF